MLGQVNNFTLIETPKGISKLSSAIRAGLQTAVDALLSKLPSSGQSMQFRYSNIGFTSNKISTKSNVKISAILNNNGNLENMITNKNNDSTDDSNSICVIVIPSSLIIVADADIYSFSYKDDSLFKAKKYHKFTSNICTATIHGQTIINTSIPIKLQFKTRPNIETQKCRFWNKNSSKSLKI